MLYVSSDDYYPHTVTPESHTPISACFVRKVSHIILILTSDFVLNNWKHLIIFYEPIFSRPEIILHTNNNYKTKILQKDEDYKIVKPVLKNGQLCLANHQCQLCKELFYIFTWSFPRLYGEGSKKDYQHGKETIHITESSWGLLMLSIFGVKLQ